MKLRVVLSFIEGDFCHSIEENGPDGWRESRVVWHMPKMGESDSDFIRRIVGYHYPESQEIDFDDCEIGTVDGTVDAQWCSK